MDSLLLAPLRAMSLCCVTTFWATAAVAANANTAASPAIPRQKPKTPTPEASTDDTRPFLSRDIGCPASLFHADVFLRRAGTGSAPPRKRNARYAECSRRNLNACGRVRILVAILDGRTVGKVYRWWNLLLKCDLCATGYSTARNLVLEASNAVESQKVRSSLTGSLCAHSRPGSSSIGRTRGNSSVLVPLLMAVRRLRYGPA
jgi:hypothetical protein